MNKAKTPQDMEKIEAMIARFFDESEIPRNAALRKCREAQEVFFNETTVVCVNQNGLEVVLDVPEVIVEERATRTMDEAREAIAADKEDKSFFRTTHKRYTGGQWLNRPPVTVAARLDEVETELQEKMSDKQELEWSCAGKEPTPEQSLYMGIHSMTRQIRMLWEEGNHEKAACEMLKLGQLLERAALLPFEKPAGHGLSLRDKTQLTATWNRACEAGAKEEADYLKRGENPRDARKAALDCIRENMPPPKDTEESFRKTMIRRYSKWRKANPDKMPSGCLR